MSLDTLVIVAAGALVSICTAIFASVTAPAILLRRTEQRHREDRDAEWARQDKVAEAAAKAAEDLRASQKAIADKAAEAADLLLAANERVAQTAAQTNGKLDVIHTLVNSNMTAAMQSELDATRRELALMLDNMRLNAAAGQQATVATLANIEATTAKVAELTAAMSDRLKASDKIEAAAAAAAAAAADTPSVT